MWGGGDFTMAISVLNQEAFFEESEYLFFIFFPFFCRATSMEESKNTHFFKIKDMIKS